MFIGTVGDTGLNISGDAGVFESDMLLLIGLSLEEEVALLAAPVSTVEYNDSVRLPAAEFEAVFTVV